MQPQWYLHFSFHRLCDMIDQSVISKRFRTEFDAHYNPDPWENRENMEHIEHIEIKISRRYQDEIESRRVEEM